MNKLEPNEVYSTKEAQDFLKISKSTMKRFLKRGILKANKVGGRYKILGSELLRLVSPRIERKAKSVYGSLKQKTKNNIEKW